MICNCMYIKKKLSIKIGKRIHEFKIQNLNFTVLRSKFKKAIFKKKKFCLNIFDIKFKILLCFSVYIVTYRKNHCH